MKRSAFLRKPPAPSLARVREWTGADPRPRLPASVPINDPVYVMPVPKENAIQHLGYMKLVRKLACARCLTTAVPRQFCHRDEGKGLWLKTDCREGWPGCAPCHFYVGSTGRMSKEGRREFELFAGAATRAQIEMAGTWPARLPRWVT